MIVVPTFPGYLLCLACSVRGLRVFSDADQYPAEPAQFLGLSRWGRAIRPQIAVRRVMC